MTILFKFIVINSLELIEFKQVCKLEELYFSAEWLFDKMPVFSFSFFHFFLFLLPTKEVGPHGTTYTRREGSNNHLCMHGSKPTRVRTLDREVRAEYSTAGLSIYSQDTFQLVDGFLPLGEQCLAASWSWDPGCIEFTQMHSNHWG